MVCVEEVDGGRPWNGNPEAARHFGEPIPCLVRRFEQKHDQEGSLGYNDEDLNAFLGAERYEEALVLVVWPWRLMLSKRM